METHNQRSELHEVSQVHVPLCGLVGVVRLSGQCRKVNVEVPPRVRGRTEGATCVCEAGDGMCTEGENAGEDIPSCFMDGMVGLVLIECCWARVWV